MEKFVKHENAFGRTSVLHMCAAVEGQNCGRSYLKELRFTAPFKVMTPFQKPDGGIEVMTIAVSAGIMAGDTQEISIETEPGASLTCTSQSFEKIHRMDGGRAVRRTTLTVGDDSFLSYRPLPVIPFADSSFESVTDIALEGSRSRLVYQEILSCGRVARGERFAYSEYLSRIEVRREGHLIYRENCRFKPSDYDMESTGMFEGYTHLANLLLFLPAESAEDMVRAIIDAHQGDACDMCGGVSRTAYGDLVVRILGRRAQELQDVCDVICGAFGVRS